ncbi:MAG: hypothetical protein ACTIM4_12070 [Marinomonas sp.]
MMWKLSDSINNRWAIVTLVIGLCLTVFIAQRVNCNGLMILEGPIAYN